MSSARFPSPSAPEIIQPYTLFTQQLALPPGKLFLLHGREPVFRLAHTVASYALRSGMRIAVADGGNWFNVHALIHAARAAHTNPDLLLKAMYVSRSFTCYQMEQTVAHLLPTFLKSIDSRMAIIFGPLDTLYDEQAPLREVRHILQRILAALQAMKANGVSVLIASLDRSVLPEERNRFSGTLAKAMDHVYRLEYDRSEQPLLVRENPSSILHHPLSAKHSIDHNLPKGASHGTHRTDVHQHHRQRTDKLVQVPPGPSPRRPRGLR
ncbi:MAG: hypothetical protein WEB33_10480 [Bacteroidota bacterium]